MTTISQNDMRELITRYKLNVDSGIIKEDLTCLICKKLMIDAYQTFCGCQYCQACIFDYLAKGERHCPGNNFECKDEYLVLEKNVNRNAILNRKVLKVKVICPHESCTYKTELSKIEGHIRICIKQSIAFPYMTIDSGTEKATKDTILTHPHNETLPPTQLLIDLIHNLRNEIGSLKDKLELSSMANKAAIERIRTECADKEHRIATLEHNSRDRDMSHFDTRTKIRKLDATMDSINMKTKTIGVTTFTVNQFNAWKNAKQRIYSPYFYSHTNGYKLRLEVIPGGIGDGSGTHLSAFFIICKGEYDDILPWPCKYSFELAIVNQLSGVSHRGDILSYDLDKVEWRYLYYKPIDKDNIGSGHHTLVSHNYLRSVNGFIVNDSIIIKCTVRPPVASFVDM